MFKQQTKEDGTHNYHTSLNNNNTAIMSTKEQNQDDVVVVEATDAVPVVDTAEAIAYEVPGGRWKVRTIYHIF